MTSIKRIPKNVLGTRRGNTLEQEREQFERLQESSFKKAINDDEGPVKMKHVRNMIIGSHTDKNGEMFWRQVVVAPPMNTDVTAWKFCHTLHLFLRDGHPNVIKDSIRCINRIKDVGEHFRHLNHGYGPLILRYCELLVCKLSFHQHNPRFPGVLAVSQEELQTITENDANSYFELAVEMLEYMENILNLYTVVSASLDPSRANSMTRMGQCRIAPLIPCIQDSSCLYDLIVRILFQLHKATYTSMPSIVSLPVAMLSGHRTRFCEQFRKLKQFYDSTRNLQYFKDLIQVPPLPSEPPNFLIEAELSSHVAPVVVIEDNPDSVDMQEFVLVDTSEPEPPPIPPHPKLQTVDVHNGQLAEVIAEKESLIDALHAELESSRADVQRLRSESEHREQELRLKINDLESTVGELDSELLAERQSKESILNQVEAAAACAEAVTRLSDEETKRRTAEEKFNKMKDAYQKLRLEHINLIRAKAEIDKQLAAEKQTLFDEKRKCENLNSKLNGLEGQVQQNGEMKESLEKQQEEKASMDKELSSTKQERDQVMIERDALHMALSEVKQQMTQQLDELNDELCIVKNECSAKQIECVKKAVDSGMTVVAFSLSHFDQEMHLDIKSTPEYTLLYKTPVETSLDNLMMRYSEYINNANHAPDIVKEVDSITSYLAEFLLYAKATSHASPDIEKADNLVSSLEELSEISRTVLSAIKERSPLDETFESFHNCFHRCCALLKECEDKTATPDDVDSIVEKEMETMDKAIQEAVQKFTQMLEDSRAKDTGMQLEVNENILATCRELMAAVRLLVQRASDLQTEIIAAGRGGASPKDFYKRNHRWTEGLISGAKSVAVAAQALMSAADKVVSGGGKFEEVMVASREIAASSMQLVIASRVKADRGSQKLSNLNSASKTISSLTGTVVATAENCRDKLQEHNTLDFSNLSLHSTKKLEMETLVKVLETEKNLELERTKLAELRKYHYKLAGELEGWDPQETE